MPSSDFLRFTPMAQRDHRTHAVAREESEAKRKQKQKRLIHIDRSFIKDLNQKKPNDAR